MLSTSILQNAKSSSDVFICGSAFIELGIGLRGSLGSAEIIETLQNLYALTSPIREIPLTNTILLSGLEIVQELGISNLFDCLHAATAKSHDSVIISDDAFYDRVPNLERISLKEFASRRE
jgi:predicted nucleic acid-binding protein